MPKYMGKKRADGVQDATHPSKNGKKKRRRYRKSKKKPKRVQQKSVWSTMTDLEQVVMHAPPQDVFSCVCNCFLDNCLQIDEVWCRERDYNDYMHMTGIGTILEKDTLGYEKVTHLFKKRKLISNECLNTRVLQDCYLNELDKKPTNDNIIVYTRRKSHRRWSSPLQTNEVVVSVVLSYCHFAERKLLQHFLSHSHGTELSVTDTFHYYNNLQSIPNPEYEQHLIDSWKCANCAMTNSRVEVTCRHCLVSSRPTYRNLPKYITVWNRSEQLIFNKAPLHPRERNKKRKKNSRVQNSRFKHLIEEKEADKPLQNVEKLIDSVPEVESDSPQKDALESDKWMKMKNRAETLSSEIFVDITLEKDWLGYKFLEIMSFDLPPPCLLLLGQECINRCSEEISYEEMIRLAFIQNTFTSEIRMEKHGTNKMLSRVATLGYRVGMFSEQLIIDMLHYFCYGHFAFMIDSPLDVEVVIQIYNFAFGSEFNPQSMNGLEGIFENIRGSEISKKPYFRRMMQDIRLSRQGKSGYFYYQVRPLLLAIIDGENKTPPTIAEFCDFMKQQEHP